MRFSVRSNERLSEKLVILSMCSNPKPDRAFGTVYGQRTIVRAHTGRPKASDLLEAHGWILRVLLEMVVSLIRQPADVFL